MLSLCGLNKHPSEAADSTIIISLMQLQPETEEAERKIYGDGVLQVASGYKLTQGPNLPTPTLEFVNH